MVEGVVGCDVQHFHFHLSLHDVEKVLLLDVAGEGFGVLVTGVEAQPCAVDVEVYFVVCLLLSSECGGVEGEG